MDSAEVEADDASGGNPLSADGRYVAFASLATNLVTGDTNGWSDVFVRDRVAGTTERVSVDSAEAQANSDGGAPSISMDGRCIAFLSDSTNLVIGDTNGRNDVFVRDRFAGTTERVSVDSTGAEAEGGFSGNQHFAASISGDCRYIAFESDATNLVIGDTNGRNDVFVRDRQLGTTELVSVGSAEQGNVWDAPAMSIDGRYVAFASSSPDLVSADTNGGFDIFVRDRVAGTTERVSVDGAEMQVDGPSYAPQISPDARYVAFESYATNLVVDDTNGWSDVFVRDRLAGITERVSVDSSGAQAVGDYSWRPSISADGRYVAFDSYATNLVTGDTNGVRDSFLRDRLSGTTERVNVDNSGAQGDLQSWGASISADGRYIAFDSYATNLVTGDANGVRDVFVRSYDDDNDGIHEHADNCPNWPNPAQNLPVWSVPAGDSDCDGFPDTATAGARGRENFMATDPADQCPDNSGDNAWPPDVNNSGATNLSDVVLFGPTFNKTGPNAPYNPRFDLNAAPQPNGAVNLSDVVAIGPFFNKFCTP